jgi:MFS family permease
VTAAQTRRAVAAGCVVGLSTGWNGANLGGVAEQLAATYGTELATVGLLTTALFLTHFAVQIPAGRASDRFGPRRVALAGLAALILFNALALVAADVGLALLARALVGVGTGTSFLAASAYIRACGGSPVAQGLFGGITIAGGGIALVVVPRVESLVGWQSAYLTAVVVGSIGIAAMLAARADPRPERVPDPGSDPGRVPPHLLRDPRLWRLAAIFAASLGLSLIVGNWAVTLLIRHGAAAGPASVVASLTLLLGIVTRPLGGWILRARPRQVRLAVGTSLAAGALGTLALMVAEPLPLAALGAVLVGFAAGVPFAPAFTGAAQAHPGSPAAAVGFVNGAASALTIVGTPLVGLTFSLPGDGRIGFAAVMALWVVALLALPSGRDLGAV